MLKECSDLAEVLSEMNYREVMQVAREIADRLAMSRADDEDSSAEEVAFVLTDWANDIISAKGGAA